MNIMQIQQIRLKIRKEAAQAIESRDKVAFEKAMAQYDVLAEMTDAEIKKLQELL